MSVPAPVTFARHPSQYRHWLLTFDGPVATLSMNVDEDGGLRPGYALKLNSYDLGVDIELHDALQRIRFEHPGGAHRDPDQRPRPHFLLGRQHLHARQVSSHAWKVNFCKFTNETRNGIEDASRPLRPQVPRRLQRRLRPAAATNWRWPATRSCWWTTAPPPSGCPKCRCWACCPAPAA